MLGGYNISPADRPARRPGGRAGRRRRAEEDAADVRRLPRRAEPRPTPGNANAKAVLQSWADAEWFTSRPEVPRSITVTVFKVTGETNTDDLSPAPDAWSRPGHPAARPGDAEEPARGHHPREDARGPIRFDRGSRRGHLVAYVGDVVGTGSSRKSATNSVPWFTLAKTSPSSPTSASAASAWAARSRRSSTTPWKTPARSRSKLDVSQMGMGDTVELRPYEGKASRTARSSPSSRSRATCCSDEVRAGGRIP